MAAFMIVFAKVHDRAKFLELYGKPAADLVAKMGGHYIVRAPGGQLLEGPFGDGASVVVSQWPNKKAIEAFWNSDAYQKLKAVRQPLADVNVVIVEEPK